MSVDQDIVEELRLQWKKLWQERVDDKQRAEGMATADYLDLYVEKGTVIHATRDYKAVSFKEILEQHLISNPDRYIPPNPQVGGWKKFVKTSISNRKPRNTTRATLYQEEPKGKQQPKKGGRGWLHK